jgi:hypothetical protein
VEPVARCSGEGWGFYGRFNSGLGGLFSLAVDSRAFLDEWFVCPYWGRGNSLESILFISPVADLSDPVPPLQDAEMQIYNSSGCRNAGLQLLPPQGAGVTVPSMGDGILPHLP